jgi:hypothetical protein
MLRGIIICPDADLSERLEALLNDIGIVSVTRTLDRSVRNRPPRRWKSLAM